jgi:hypothetical protein
MPNNMSFNFNNLNSVFAEAISRHEPSIVFPLSNGKGLFVFLLFIPTDSNGHIKYNTLELNIIFGRTQAFLSRDLYGSHKKGDFKIYFNQEHELMFKKELGIESATTGNFDFTRFLDELNNMIPQSLPLESKIATMKDHSNLIQINCSKHIDSAMRIYLLGTKKLPSNQKPKEETLRKLMMLKGEPDEHARFINSLKKLNWTLRWTDKKPTEDAYLQIWKAVQSQK